MTWDTPQWRPSAPWWGLCRGTDDRLCGAWSRSWWPDGPCQQTMEHTWWAEGERLNTGSGSVPGPFQLYWKPPMITEQHVWRWYTWTCSFSHVFFLTHRVQRGWSSHIRKEANLQDMEQEVLIINAINSIQEQHHGRLVVRYKTGRHFWLNNLTICSFDKTNQRRLKRNIYIKKIININISIYLYIHTHTFLQFHI